MEERAVILSKQMNSVTEPYSFEWIWKAARSNESEMQQSSRAPDLPHQGCYTCVEILPVSSQECTS